MEDVSKCHVPCLSKWVKVFEKADFEIQERPATVSSSIHEKRFSSHMLHLMFKDCVSGSR